MTMLETIIREFPVSDFSKDFKRVFEDLTSGHEEEGVQF